MKALKTAETQLKTKLQNKGWKIVHKGWPDFACIKKGEMMFVEVKSYRGEMLKEEQHFILTHLARLGLACYKWSPDGGFEQIVASTRWPKPLKKKNNINRKRLTPEERLAKYSPEEREQIKQDEANGKTRFY